MREYRLMAARWFGLGLLMLAGWNWKKQLLDGAAGVFEDGGAAVEGVAREAQVDLLYRQIGQLKVENDFLARKLGK